MAQFRWVREDVVTPHPEGTADTRPLGDAARGMIPAGWQPLFAVPDPEREGCVLVLMRKG